MWWSTGEIKSPSPVGGGVRTGVGSRGLEVCLPPLVRKFVGGEKPLGLNFLFCKFCSEGETGC